MHDINGKVLHVGDEITSYGIGLSKILRVLEEDNEQKEGASVEVSVKGQEKVRQIRLIQAGVVKLRTWKELAQEAIQVQDASNLSGVVQSFAIVVREVRARLEDEGKGGTANVNSHPVCVLYADKIQSLTGADGTFSAAYGWATEQAK